MPLIKPTSRIYHGTNPLGAFYKGTHKVWEPVVVAPPMLLAYDPEPVPGDWAGNTIVILGTGLSTVTIISIELVGSFTGYMYPGTDFTIGGDTQINFTNTADWLGGFTGTFYLTPMWDVGGNDTEVPEGRLTLEVATVPAGAVRFNGTSGTSLKRSASGLTLTSTSITWCCWVKLMADQNFYSWVMCSDDASSNYVQFGCDATGTHFYMSSNSGGGGSSYDFTIGTWAFVAAVMDKTGTSPQMYWAEAPATTLSSSWIYTLPAGFLDTNTFYIGNGGFNNPINASIASVKIWNAALTQAELEDEMYKYAPQRTANLWAYYGFQNGPQTNDESGNGRTLTQVGTPPTVDTSGPPIT